MQTRALFGRLPLVAFLGLTFVACGDQLADPSAPLPPAAKWVSMEFSLKPLIPAEPDVYVLELDDNVDPQLLADRLGLELERILDGNIIVVSGVLNEALLQDGDILLFENNQETSLAFGQELTMGFFEGHEFELTDLEENRPIKAIGIYWGPDDRFGRGAKVGVLDTGVDPEHLLLAGKISPPQDQTFVGYLEDPNGLDDDGDGLIDEAFGHGTFVAGMISQVAPGATIVPARVLNADGFGSLADLLTGIDAVKAEGIHVLNLSLSLSNYSQLLEDRLAELAAEGIIIVAAAGNGGGATAYPANSTHTIGVAAIDTSTLLASFSNAGPDCEIAAPGVGVLSSYPEDRLAFGNGTSFAAPVVAAAFAILVDFELPAEILWEFTKPLNPLIHGELNLLTRPDGRTGRFPVELSRY